MEERTRNTGIDVIGDAPWGTHFCQFYRTKQDLIDILVPYFKAGLESNEFCMWVTSEPLRGNEALAALRAAMPDLDRYLEDGQLEVLPYSQWYTAGGAFDSTRVLNGWVEKLDRAIARGFSGLRLTGNTFWLEKEDWKDFTDYEEEVNTVIGKYPMMAICTYCLDRCGSLEVIDVIKNHQFALIRQGSSWEIIENAERKRMAEALQENNERLEFALEVTQIGAWDLDLVNHTAWRSVRHDQIFGYESPLPEWTYEMFLEHVLAEDRAEVDRRFQQAVAERQDWNFECRICRTDGEIRWIWAYGRGRYSDRGEPVRMRGWVQDITDWKRAEEKTRQQNAVLEGINRISREALICATEEELGRTCLAVAEEVTQSRFGFIGEINSQGRLDDIAISDPGWAACRMSSPTGHRRPPTAFAVHGIYGRVIKDGKAFFTNDPASHPDSIGAPAGHPPITAFLGVPLTRGGKTVGMVGMGNREGGYRAEDLAAMEALAPAIMEALMRKRADEALRQTRDYLENLFNYANAPIIVWDRDYRVTRFNHAFEHLTGYTASEVVGQKLHILFPEPSREESLSKIAQTLAGEQWDSVEIPIRRKDGDTRVALWNSANIYVETGQTLLATIAQGQDITERKRAEQLLAQQAQELADSVAELEQFAYVASHDLQEPLRMVTSYVQLLARRYEGRLDADANEFIGFAVDGAKRMQQLINDLLAYSRVGTRGRPFEPVDSGKVLAETLSNLQLAIRESGAIVTYDDLPTVMADPTQLGQLFQNLIGNALKFRGGSRRASISRQSKAAVNGSFPSGTTA